MATGASFYPTAPTPPLSDTEENDYYADLPTEEELGAIHEVNIDSREAVEHREYSAAWRTKEIAVAALRNLGFFIGAAAIITPIVIWSVPSLGISIFAGFIALIAGMVLSAGLVLGSEALRSRDRLF
ncbi:MAG: hypothetical protein COT85_01095 [Chlamydiae bacterium CG10_big_fil_rev_8_21_14_0_10_42_34]|nr:MAG: hypothetical protein COT85_01095 [Chlamydiae bacterium CG10_big_fil_rev_8_21_14_0_10_42_34]